MIGAYIAVGILVSLWGFVLINVARATNFKQLYRSLRAGRGSAVEKERKHYRKKGWTEREE